MKKLLLLIFVFLTVSAYSQEICNNGIDDDNDGLVDINDPDCSCSNTTAVPSLIPNPSFEILENGCPTTYSQLDHAANWEQATAATSDYFNCQYYFSGIAASGLSNYPDGTGITGGFYLRDYKEYLGANLLSPMLAGTAYKFSFNIAAFSEVGGIGDASNLPVSTFGPVNVTLYGSANLATFPLNTYGAPSTYSPNWVEIGHVSYSPVSAWAVITIDFTPTFNVNSIILGAPPVMPLSYPSLTDTSDIYPYFLYDGLILNKTSYFESAVIGSTGSFCTNNVVLNVTNPLPGYTPQWYLNGVAIQNATGLTLAITNYVASDFYSVRYVNGAFCSLSEPFFLSTFQPEKPVVSNLSYCQNENATALSAVGTNLLWYAAAAGGTGNPVAPTPSTSMPGNFSYYVTQSCGIESQRAEIQVTVNPLLVPDFPAISAICFGENAPALSTVAPNGMTGNWSPGIIDNQQSGNYTFHSNSLCSSDQTLHVEVNRPIEFDIEGGCVSGSYALQAFPTGGTFNLNQLTFYWEDSNGNHVGQNDPKINIGALSDAANGPSKYKLTITDANGCKASKDFTPQKTTCEIQKGISPNNDGNNDFFDLVGLNAKRLEIFNRYGTKVYARDNYINEWKGQTDSGKELPSAAYYYYIEFENQKSKTGWVYLNK